MATTYIHPLGVIGYSAYVYDLEWADSGFWRPVTLCLRCFESMEMTVRESEPLAVNDLDDSDFDEEGCVHCTVCATVIAEHEERPCDN